MIHKEMYEDSEKMPNCFEKNILKIIFFLGHFNYDLKKVMDMDKISLDIEKSI